MIRAVAAELHTPKLLIAAVCLCGYALLFRASLPRTGAPVGAAEAGALFLTNAYPILFVAVPLWLAISVRAVDHAYSWSVVIRSPSTVEWIARGVRDAVPCLAALLLVELASCVVAGLGLTADLDWVRFRANPHDPLFPAGVGQSDLTPVGAVGVQVVVFTIAAATAYALLAGAVALTGRRLAPVVIGALLFADALVAHVVAPSGWLALVAVDSYLSPFTAQTALGGWWCGPVVLLMILGAVAVLCRLRDGRRARLQVRPHLGGAIVASAVGLTALASWSSAAHGADVADTLREVFQGIGGAGGVQILWLFFGTVVFMVPPFVASTTLADHLQDLLLYVLLRTGSVGRLIASQCARHAVLFTAYVIALMGVAVVVAAGVRAVTGDEVQVGAFSPLMAYQFFVNGVLQLLFYWAAAWSALLVSGRSAAPIVMLAVLLGLALFPAGPDQVFLPTFGNSMARLRVGWSGVLATSVVLSSAILFVLAVACGSVRRRGLFIA